MGENIFFNSMIVFSRLFTTDSSRYFLKTGNNQCDISSISATHEIKTRKYRDHTVRKDTSLSLNDKRACKVASHEMWYLFYNVLIDP